MENLFKNIVALLVALLVIAFVFDFLNITAWLLYPWSCLTGKNTGLTSSLGNSLQIGANANASNPTAGTGN